jgi:hypothetical protein
MDFSKHPSAARQELISLFISRRVLMTALSMPLRQRGYVESSSIAKDLEVAI